LLVILLGGAAAMGLLFVISKSYLRRSSESGAPSASETDTRGLWEAGQRELREGNAHLALKKFNAAIDQHGRDPHALGREEIQRLYRLRRQSELLAHLLDNSLEEILQQAMQIRNEDEWHAKFADYRGRGVLFEDVLRRDAADRPVLGNYVPRAADVQARVALDDLALLRPLPLDPPRRWLFGARLASCRREEGGVWTFHFEPDSGVLVTEEAAAAACWPGPLDEELRALLRYQEERTRP
jgi:hypothetical protein